MRVPAERDEARVGQEGGELTSPSDRHGAVAAAVQHEGRCRHRGQVGARVGGQVELEERRGDVRAGSMALSATQGLDLLPAAARHEQPREHLRSEGPVRGDEVDERPARRVRDVVTRGVPAEVDDLADTAGLGAREPRRGESRARAGEERDGLVAARGRDRGELGGLALGRRGAFERAVGEPGAEPVVADDAELAHLARHRREDGLRPVLRDELGHHRRPHLAPVRREGGILEQPDLRGAPPGELPEALVARRVGEPDGLDVAARQPRRLADHLGHDLLRRSLAVVLDDAPERVRHVRSPSLPRAARGRAPSPHPSPRPG